LIPLPPRPRHRCLPLAAALLLVPLTAPSAQPGEQVPSRLPQSPAPWVEPAPELFGAIAFTADGSFASAWKSPSKAKVEAKVLAECSEFKRGRCELVSVRDGLCAAIATFHVGEARKVTYAGGGLTPADAQRLALQRCNGDQRSGRKCQVRTVVCGDGR
jgi:Domain of unknown function (DUF4189)